MFILGNQLPWEKALDVYFGKPTAIDNLISPVK